MTDKEAKPTRAVKMCAPGHTCSMEEINEIAKEVINEMNDPDIDRYRNPDEAQMRKIIERAEAYTGDWYHTEVTFPLGTTGRSSKPSGEPLNPYFELVHRIEELGEDHGIFLMYGSDDELSDEV